ncbi:cadherin repeat domain-containing protein, partial [Porticoccaceae bacterium]|nr:cadherin repeat domain-containing protein [Porticoccaceae bacterium]
MKFDYSQVYFRVLQTKLKERKDFNDYPTVSGLQQEVKGFVALFPNTPALADIELFTTFSELGGADLAAALVAEYNIEISQEEQLDSAFRYGSLFERILAKELPSVNKLKQVLAPYNKGIIKEVGSDVLDVPLLFLSLGTPSDDNKQTDAVIKAITTTFDIKTTQEELDRITSANEPQYAWVDKIQSLEIPVTITYADTSGMVGEDVTLTSTDALRYCDDGVCQCFPEDITGTWALRPKAGSMGVGRAEGNIGDWSATDFVWSTQRACLWDDEYIFKATSSTNTKTGSFVQRMGDSTWMEAWQPPNIGVEECGTPYPPFDGSVSDMRYTWDIEEGTLTLKGLNQYNETTGAHIGLPRVVNGTENKGTPTIADVVYSIETASDEIITLNIRSGGPSPWWHFELQKIGDGGSGGDEGELDSGGVEDSEDSEESGGSCANVANPVDIEAIDIDTEQGTVTLVLSGALLAPAVPSAEDFQVTQAGLSLSVDSVTVDESDLILAVTGFESGAVQVSYTRTNKYLPLKSFTQMIVSDGYIRDAKVYADLNNDGTSELLKGVTTDALGQLLLSGDFGDTQIIIDGGVNVDTGAVNHLELTAPAGYSVINPLSTLVQKIVASDNSQTLEQAEEILTQALGITLAAGETLSTYDPISDVSENALANRVATTQIATVLAVAAAADEADDSVDSNIESAVLSNLAELVTSTTDPLVMDEATVVGILSDEQGNNFAVDINAATTAVVAMEAIKQDPVSVDLTVALGNMIKAQAVAIDEVRPAPPVLTIKNTDNNKDPELKISFSTALKGGYAVVVGDMVEIFEAGNSVTTYVLQKADIDKRNYTFQLPVSDDIDTSYTATIKDIAGNISNQSESVVYDTVAPIITSGASVSVDENTGTGNIIYTTTASDTDTNITFTLFDITKGFSIIDPSTGVVTTNANFVANFESENGASHSFTVVATDSEDNTSNQVVTVAINNLDEFAPTISSGGSAATIAENSGAGQVVYIATATDTDANIEGITLSLADDALGFSIDASTGVVTTNAVFAADFEVAQSQSFVVVATDVAGNASQQTVSVAVNNVDEAAPVFQSSTTASVLESETAGVAVYQVQVDDSSDISNGVTYSLSGVDAQSFNIDQAGKISIIDDPEAAVKPSYSFTVIASDGVNQSQLTVTLSVETEPDTVAPVFTSSATP